MNFNAWSTGILEAISGDYPSSQVGCEMLEDIGGAFIFGAIGSL